MKIVLLGKNGQVGWELQRALQPLGQVVDFSRDSEDGLSGDVTNFGAIQKIITTQKPDIVVNATAYTAVDKAEEEITESDLVNHIAIKNLAKLCKQHSCLLIHYSTDYVFDGNKQSAWLETDTTHPINQYGTSKLKGEIAIEQSGCQFIILRTSWVYGVHGNNFIKTMLKIAQTKEELNIVADQIGAPTGAALIADVTAQLIRYYLLQPKPHQQALLGCYHLTAQGYSSWYEYANFVFETARNLGCSLSINQVNPVTTQQYPTPAKRPLNSRLNSNKLQTTFGLHLPHWKLGVSHALQALILTAKQ